MTDQVYLGTIFVNNDSDTSGLKSGDIVQLDSTLDNAVIKVVGANSANVIGVVVVGGSKGSQVTICGFTGQRIRLNIDGAATVNRGDQLVSDGVISGYCKVDNAATADQVFAVAIAAKNSGVGSQVEALYLAPSISNATGSGASAAGYYIVTRSTNAPVNATNLGTLSSGFLKATVSAGVAVISTDTSTGAPEDAKYILQQPDGSLSNAQSLSSLPTGLLKNTTTTGVLSTAIVNTDYPSVAATYVVTSSVAAPPSAVNLGALTSGLLKQTVVSGVSTLSIAIAGTDYLASAFYQTVATAGTSLPQQIKLNFDGTIVATDSTSPAQTNVGLPVMGGLTPASYSLVNITVDAYGRITAATSTTSITSLVVAAAPGGLAFFNSSGELTDDPAHANWNTSTNTATISNLAVSSLASSLVKSSGSGLLQNATDGVDFISPTTAFYQILTVNGITQTQRGQLGFSTNFTNTDTASPARSTIDLSTTSVTAGSYTNTNITVDAFGRITAASTGSSGGGGSVVSVSGTAGNISSTGGITPVINLITTGVTPGSYTYSSFTVDTFGRLTSASSGTSPIVAIAGTSPIFATGTSTVTLTLQGGFVSGSTSTTAQNLGTLTTGLLKGTVSGGINTISTAVAGTDYQGVGNYITALVGDVTATGPGSATSTIANNVVSNQKFRQSAALSVVGNPTSATVNVQDIVATSTGQALWNNGGTLVFAALPYSTLTGTPTSLPPSGTAGGSLGGTYPNPTVTLTAGAVGFGNASNVLAGDTANFHWDSIALRQGIRVAAPSFQLHLVDESAAADRGLAVASYVTSTAGPSLRLLKYRGSFASPTTVTNTDYLGRVGFDAYDGTNPLQVAELIGHVTSGATVATGSVPSEIGIAMATTGVTDPYGNNSLMAARFLSTGSVGFGLLANDSFQLAGGGLEVGAFSGTTSLARTRITGGSISLYGPSSSTGVSISRADGGIGLMSIGFAAGGLSLNGSSTNVLLGNGVGSPYGLTFRAQLQNQVEFTSASSLTATNWGLFRVTLVSLSESIPADSVSMAGAIPLDSYFFRGATYVFGGGANTNAQGFNQFTIGAPTLNSSASVAVSMATLALLGPPIVSGITGPVYGFDVQGATTDTSIHTAGGVKIDGQASTALRVSTFTAGYVKSSSTGFFSVSAAISASDVTGLFYQTVSEVGSSLTQQPILNFDGTVVASNGSGKTNVGLPLQGGLTASAYTYANFTVDAFGRLTIASNGADFGPSGVSHAHGLVPDPGSSTGSTKFLREDGTWTVPAGTGGTITSVSGTAGRISSIGSTAVVLDLVSTSVTPGTYTYSSFTVDAFGRLTAASSGTNPMTTATAPLFVSGGNITIQGSIVSGSTSTSAQNLGVLSSGLLQQSVTSGVSTLAIAVPGTDYVSSVSSTTPIVNVGTAANPDFALAASGVSAGSYTNTNITVDALGRITAASNGSSGAAFYQAVQTNGSALTQRAAINFNTAFTITDNSGAGRTDVALVVPTTTQLAVSDGTKLTGNAGLTFASGNLLLGNSVKLGGLLGNSMLFTDSSGFVATDSFGFTYNSTTHTLSPWHLAVGSSATMGDLTTFGSVQFSGYAGTGGPLRVDSTGFLQVGVSFYASATIDYMVMLVANGPSTPTGSWLTSSTIPGIQIGQIYEYPKQFAANTATLKIVVVHNGWDGSGDEAINITRNGSIIGPTIHITPSTPQGAVLTIGPVAISGGSSTDTYGVTGQPTGSVTVGKEIDMTATLVLQ